MLVIGCLKKYALVITIPILINYSFADEIPVDDISNFVDVFKFIQENYNGDLNSSELIRNAIKGMVESVDDNSKYYIGSDVKSFSREYDGAFYGIGVELTQGKYGIEVISPIYGTPAYSAGIESGDTIIMINDVSTESGNSLQDGINELNSSGNLVSLKIRRNNELISKSLNKGKIKIDSIKTAKIDNEKTYIKINAFQKNTFIDFSNYLSSMDHKVNGVIIDLRGNPGGLVLEAVAISDYFMKPNNLIYSSDSKYESNKILSKTDSFFKGRIVIIIDSGTASAAEILTGALKDNGLAVVLGRKSYGKGTIQSVVRYDNGDVLKLTTASYKTPNGLEIEGYGIEPDITVYKNDVGSDKDLEEAINIINSPIYDQYIAVF